MNEGRFGSNIDVPRYIIESHPEYFSRIKEQLIYQCGQFLIPSMIDSGKYHVLKIDMFRDENEWNVSFYLRCTHMLAKEQHYTITMPESFEIPVTAKECCQWCGNVLILDKRGGCSACGGWVRGE